MSTPPYARRTPPAPVRRARTAGYASIPAVRAIEKRLAAGEREESVRASLPAVSPAEVERYREGDLYAIVDIDADPWNGATLHGLLVAADVRRGRGRMVRIEG